MYFRSKYDKDQRIYLIETTGDWCLVYLHKPYTYFVSTYNKEYVDEYFKNGVWIKYEFPNQMLRERLLARKNDV